MYVDPIVGVAIMSNTSATGGFLKPDVLDPPQNDAALDAILQRLVVGLTNLTGDLVRPRWQVKVPKQPEPSVNWCAIGVLTLDPKGSPAIQHSSTGQGSDSLSDHEYIEVLASMYGPLGQQNASMLRDGLLLPQNNEGLRAFDMRYNPWSESIRAVPEYVNTQWVRRYDFFMHFRRSVSRTYSVLNIVAAEAVIRADASKGIITANVVVNAG